jgi:hypothetical protein
MTLAVMKEKRINWGWCPVCIRERRIIGNAMRPHRRYIPFTVTDPETGLPGYMQTCEGIGMSPLSEVETRGRR